MAGCEKQMSIIKKIVDDLLFEHGRKISYDFLIKF